ncbi:MAG: hypothetical protein LBH31_02915 [Burkholderiaceae bacterium]|jgi:uncharacterized protein|nr:hypothetical protein [Burkholderiaceae bacterium]
MKALLILLVIAAVVWLFKRGQHVSASDAHPSAKSVVKPQPMLRCARCGVHLPASNAIAGRAGRAYCCATHQREAESG